MDKLGRYVAELNTGSRYDDALLSTLGLTPEELLEEVKDYINQDSLLYSRMRLEDVTIVDYSKIRPLKKDEAKHVIQDLLDLVQTFRKGRSTQ